MLKHTGEGGVPAGFTDVAQHTICYRPGSWLAPSGIQNSKFKISSASTGRGVGLRRQEFKIQNSKFLQPPLVKFKTSSVHLVQRLLTFAKINFVDNLFEKKRLICFAYATGADTTYMFSVLPAGYSREGGSGRLEMQNAKFPKHQPNC
jgi:hypothetical protein